MLRIFIVDDEPSVLEGLHFFCDKKEIAAQIVGEATNGQDAIDGINETKPDVVICDIRLPLVDGLTVLEKTKEKNPSLKFIVLSGNKKFEDAKRALLFDAMAYVTKPIDPQELTLVLEQAVAEIEKEKIKDQEQMDLFRYFANQVYMDLLDGFRNKSTIQKARHIFSVDKIIGMRLGHVVVREELGVSQINNFYEVLMQSLRIQNPNRIFPINNHTYQFILAQSEAHHTLAIELDCKKAIQALQPMDISIFLSSFFCGDFFEGIPILATQLDEMETVAWVEGYKGIYLYETFPQPISKDFTVPNISLQPVLQALKGDNRDHLVQTIDKCFATLDAQKISWQVYSIFLYKLVDEVTKLAICYGINMTDEVKDFAHSKPLVCKNIVQRLCLNIFDKQRLYEQKPIDVLENDIIEYVRINSNQEMSIRTIAEVFAMSPLVVSKIIRKKTGLRFNDYLNNIRIEKAKALLLSSDMKIGFIAKECGYFDYGYFIGKFKEITGMTPSEYKKRWW